MAPVDGTWTIQMFGWDRIHGYVLRTSARAVSSQKKDKR
jgi:hypothetical protein